MYMYMSYLHICVMPTSVLYTCARIHVIMISRRCRIQYTCTTPNNYTGIQCTCTITGSTILGRERVVEGREGDCGLLMTEQILLPAVLILDTPSMSLLPSRRRMNSRKKVILALPSWIVSLETWNFTYCTCTCIYDTRRGFATHMYKTPISISKLNCAGHVLTNDRPHRLHWEYGHITCHAHVHVHVTPYIRIYMYMYMCSMRWIETSGYTGT